MLNNFSLVRVTQNANDIIAYMWNISIMDSQQELITRHCYSLRSTLCNVRLNCYFLSTYNHLRKNFNKSPVINYLLIS